MQITLDRIKLGYRGGLWVAGLVLLAAVTWICFRFKVNSATAASAYLIIIVALALLDNFAVSLVFSVIAAGCLDFFFFQPLYSLVVGKSQDLVTLAGFIGTAFVVATLVQNIRHLRDMPGQPGLGFIRDTFIYGSPLPITLQRTQEPNLFEAQKLSRTGSFGWHAHTGQVFWSDEMFRIYGFDPASKPTAEMAMQRTHPDDALSAAPILRDATKNRQSFDLKHRIVMPDGSVKHLHVVARVIKDEPGALEYIGAVMDVSEQKWAEEELRRNEQRYRYLFQYSPVPLFQIDTRVLMKLFAEIDAQSIADFSAYLDENPDFMRRVVEAHVVVDANQRAVEMFGARNASELLGSTARIWGPNPIAYRQALESRFRGDTIFQDEIKVEALDGRLIDALVTLGRPDVVLGRPDAADNAGLNFIALVDITERVRAREALKDSEQRYRALFEEARHTQDMLAQNEQGYRHLFEYSPVALAQIRAGQRAALFEELHDQGVTNLRAHLDAHPGFLRQVMEASTIENVNRRMVEMFGARSTAELLGPTLRIWQRSPEAFLRGIESRFRGEAIFQEEMEVETLDGRLINVVVTVARPEAVGGPGINFIGFVDITNQVRAREAEKLNEQRYRYLFDYSPAPLVRVNSQPRLAIIEELRAQGITDVAAYMREHPDVLDKFMDCDVIEDVNQRTLEIFGAREASELVGSSARFWRRSPDVFLKALESRLRGESFFQAEIEVDTLDGRPINVVVTVARPGNRDLTFLSFVDVSDRVRATEALQKLQADFSRAARVSMLGELAASITHEINQPLAAMMTNAEVALRWLHANTPNIAKAEQAAQRIVDDAKRTADIISRIRAMAAGRTPRHIEVPLHEIVGETIDFLSHEINANNVRVSLDIPHSLPPLIGDRIQLQQVVVNLLLNAIQAMAHAKVSRPALAIRVTCADETLHCTFEDSGPGIPPQHLEHLFDSFFTTKDAGMGMGLPISKSIIESHGGHLSGDNLSGLGGARFIATLPVQPLAPEN
ncbi:MAG TPA: PAS domain S-box protein [Xanthobacteraceae bacterium]|jgi:PAS domain S-box-containing protein|nr:PAS domain S-box protein [Xanthobacteraceae bacterium]